MPSFALPGLRGVSRPALAAVLVAALALALMPVFVKKPYVLHMGVILFLAVLQGQAWNLIGGYAGQYSVGHAAWFGVGAYVTVMLLELLQVPPWWGLPAGMAAAALLAVIVGSITFRLRGPYFVLASISVAEIIRLAALHFRGFTRGAEGFLISSLPPLRLGSWEYAFVGKRPFWYLTLALALLSIAVTSKVRHSRLGYYLQAIREDQDAAHSLGIPLALCKNVALALSAALTALAGGVFALFTRFIDPNVAFGMDVSVSLVLICIIGGIGTIAGPVIGAVVLVPLSEVLRNPRGLVQIGLLSPDSSVISFIEGAHLSHAHQLVYGLLVVVVILFAPDGVLGLLRRLSARIRSSRPAAPLPAAPNP